MKLLFLHIQRPQNFQATLNNETGFTYLTVFYWTENTCCGSWYLVHNDSKVLCTHVVSTVSQ